MGLMEEAYAVGCQKHRRLSNTIEPTKKDTKMNSQKLGLRVVGAIFGLMCLAQLLRLVIHPEVLVAGHHVPLWPSGLALMILGGLSLWMWKLARTAAQ